MRLLVVEDDLKMAGLLKRGLEEEGYAIDVARTGTDALWLGTENPYDAILLDVMLPDLDGFDVCRQLRAKGRWAPVLMLTARDTVPDRVAGLDAGADDYLAKPFSFSELFARDAQVQTVEEAIPARLLAVPLPNGDIVVVGASVEDQRDAMARLLALLLIGGPVALALASGVGRLVAGAALRPVERLRVEAEAISGSEPSRRLIIPATGDELARLGESLNRMLGRLERAAERERRFVDDASHELRTPLANLKAELDLALRRARSPQELVDALTSAAEETERLTRLAEDLLVLARADGGRLPVRREALDVGALIRDTASRFSSRAMELGISLETIAPDGVRAHIDQARMRQALSNLIDNALRHTPSSGRVTVELVSNAGVVGISVADTGEGFALTVLPRAFEPFSRGENARTRADAGAGLGLAIVRAVAEAHGGSVEASNRPEGGATVLLRVPA